MDIKELRIGNYVNRLGKPKEVTAIQMGWRDDNTPLGYLSVDGEAVTENMIEPIRITEGLLLGCGFEKTVYGFEKWGFELSYGEHVMFTHEEDKLYVSVNSEYGLGRPIEYLHHLQNCYFDFTEGELGVRI